MEFYQIRYFVAVCELKNFTRAAERCHVSQPALTRAIHSLETELGGALIIRGGKETRLTPLGELVLPTLTDMLKLTQDANMAARHHRAEPRPRLRMAVDGSVGPDLPTRLLARLAKVLPKVEIEVVVGTAIGTIDHLIAGDADMALSCQAIGDSDRRLNAVPLFREQMMLVMPDGHRLAEKSAVRVDDLADEPLIVVGRDEGQSEAEQVLKAHGVAVHDLHRCDSDTWAQSMISARLGLGIMPEQQMIPPGLIKRPFSGAGVWRSVSLITVRQRPGTIEVGALVREMARFDWTMRNAGPSVVAALEMERMAETAMRT
ncbi:MAG: LysR family transcriptional regulator [Alphaproteobacteria bacterium]